MNQEERIQTEYDEIDLMDYVKVLLKRKWLILAVLLGTAVVAGIFSFIMPKVYKIDTALEVGRIAEELVEGPLQVVEKIDGDVYWVLVREKFNISEEEFLRTFKIKAENPKDTNLVIIKIESVDSEKARRILEEINKLILADHQEKTQIKKELLEKDIERLKTKINYLVEEKKNLEAKVEALQKILPYQQTPGTQFALFDTKEKLEVKKQEIEDLYLEINSFQRALEDIQPTKIVKSPTISERPVKPKPLLNIVIAGVLGIFLGIFFAFSKEWWEKNREKL